LGGSAVVFISSVLSRVLNLEESGLSTIATGDLPFRLQDRPVGIYSMSIELEVLGYLAHRMYVAAKGHYLC